MSKIVVVLQANNGNNWKGGNLMNLIEGLQKELERNRELLQMYKEIPAGVCLAQ